MDSIDLHNEPKIQKTMLCILTLPYLLQDIFLTIVMISHFHLNAIKYNLFGDEKEPKDEDIKNFGNLM